MLREITCLLFIYFFKRGKWLHRLFSSKRVKQRWEVQRRELLSQLQFCCAAKCWTVGATFAHQCAVNMSLSQDGQRWWPHWPSTVFVFLLKSHLIKLASEILCLRYHLHRIITTNKVCLFSCSGLIFESFKGPEYVWRVGSLRFQVLIHDNRSLKARIWIIAVHCIQS